MSDTTNAGSPLYLWAVEKLAGQGMTVEEAVEAYPKDKYGRTVLPVKVRKPAEGP